MHVRIHTIRSLIREVLTTCPKCGGKKELDFGFYKRQCEKCEGSGQVDDGTQPPPAEATNKFPHLPDLEKGWRRIFVVEHALSTQPVSMILHVVDKSAPKITVMGESDLLASYPLEGIVKARNDVGDVDLTAAFDFIEAFAESQDALIEDTTSTNSAPINWNTVGRRAFDPKEWREQMVSEMGW